MPPTRAPHRRLRRILIVLVALTTLIGAALLFGPQLILRALDFVPRGNVETYWTQLEQQSSVEPPALPAILSTRRPTQVAVVPTEITPSATATFTPTLTSTPTLIKPTVVPPTVTPRVIIVRPVSATPNVAAVPSSTFTPSATLTPSSTFTPSETPTPTPTFTPTNPYADYFSVALEPDSVHVLARGYLDLSLQGNKTFANELWVGRDTSNQPFGVAEFDESAIPALCQQYFKNCRDPRFRIDRVDFRPGGMVVYGSVNVLGLYWQQVGVALLVDSDKTHLKLAGMVWNGELYEMPTTGPLATTLKDLAKRGNAALDQLNIYAGGYDLTVAELYFDDNRFIVVLKSAPPS